MRTATGYLSIASDMDIEQEIVTTSVGEEWEPTGTTVVKSSAPSLVVYHPGGTNVYFIYPNLGQPRLLGFHTGFDTQKKQFEKLAESWRKDTTFLSSTSAIVAHPAYLQIISMGQEALPFIFADLEKTHNQWFVALEAITGQNPIPKSVEGNVLKMTDLWLSYARARRFIQ